MEIIMCSHEPECVIYYPTSNITFHCWEGSKAACLKGEPVAQCKKCGEFIPVDLEEINKDRLKKGLPPLKFERIL